MRGSLLAMRDFSKGLVTAQDPADLVLGAAQAEQNVEPLGIAGLKRRAPNVLVLNPATEVDVLLYSDAKAAAYGWGASASYNLSSTLSLGSPGLDTTTLSWAEGPASGGQGPIFAQDAGSTPRYFDGSAWGNWTASAGTVPRGGLGAIAWHGNRMWVAGDSSLQSRLYFSEINDPRVWSGGTSGYVDLDPTVGGAITAVVPCGPYLLAFKKNRVYQIYDLNTGANRLVSRNIGASRQRRVCQGRFGTVYFAHPSGVYRTNGATIQKVSQQLATTFDGGNFGALAFSERYLAYQQPDGNVYLYDEQLDSWWYHTFNAAKGYIAAVSSASTGFYLADATNVYSWAPNHSPAANAAGADASGTSFTSSWTGGHLDMGAPALGKRVREAVLEGAGLESFGLGKNGVAPSSLTALTFAEANGGTIGTARVCTPGVARLWTPKMSASATAAWRIDSLTLAYTGRKN